jgi:cell division protein FtsW (lipid II flippase)
MVINLLPIVGIPLPFMSYGISNLWVNFASLGWLQCIVMQRSALGDKK